MSRRKRSRGNKLPPGKFGGIPVDVMKVAMANLTATEFRVWIAICAQSQPWSNGTAFLNKTVIDEFSLGSSRHVASGTKKMLALGLIVRTRRPRQHVAARFGVTYTPLNFDSMAKAGFSASEGEVVNASTGEVLMLPHEKRSGQKSNSVLQQLKRNGTVTPVSELQELMPSKNLPSVTGDLQGLQLGQPLTPAQALDAARRAGATVTTNGRDLRIRWWEGPPLNDLAGWIQTHAQAITGLLIAEQRT